MMKKIGVLILLVLVGVAIYFTWITLLAGDNLQLYFSTEDGMGLMAENRRIKGDKVEGVIQGLIDGPKKAELVATIPEDVQILNVKIDQGLAVVNFSEKLVTNHWGGSTGELLTVYSIVNTLCQFSNIDRVQILVEGHKIETLAGHFTLSESIQANTELIKSTGN